MPRKSAAAAPPPPRADDVANDPDLADFLKQLVNVDDAGGDRFLHPRGAANPDAVWSDLDNLDVADNIDVSLGVSGGALGAVASVASADVRRGGERVAVARAARDASDDKIGNDARDSDSPASVGGDLATGSGGSGGTGSSATSAVKTLEHLGETLRVLSDQLRAARARSISHWSPYDRVRVVNAHP